MKAFDSFFNQFPVKFVPKGEIILQQSDVPIKAYVIKKGIIAVSNITRLGEQKILSFKIMGDMLPVCWIFSKTTSALFFYQAHTDVELYVMDRKDIIDFIKSNHEYAKFVLDKQITSYINSELQVDALEQSRANLKLLYTFRHLALTHALEVAKNTMKITIPLTQQDIANFTGLTRETAALELNKLIVSGIVTLQKKYLVVRTDKINNLIFDEYDPGLVIQEIP